MGNHSRDKGARGEREVARLLAEELGTAVVRNLAQAREGGADLLGVGGFAVEVKRARRATPGLVRAWWAQAEAQAETAGKVPALLYREDRQAWQAVVPLAAKRRR